MLSNAYFLAKFRFDTAENEPAKNLQNFAKILPILLTLTPNRSPTSDPPSDEYRVVHWNGGSSHRASFEARELRELRSIHHLV